MVTERKAGYSQEERQALIREFAHRIGKNPNDLRDHPYLILKGLIRSLKNLSEGPRESREVEGKLEDMLFLSIRELTVQPIGVMTDEGRRLNAGMSMMYRSAILNESMGDGLKKRKYERAYPESLKKANGDLYPEAVAEWIKQDTAFDVIRDLLGYYDSLHRKPSLYEKKK